MQIDDTFDCYVLFELDVHFRNTSLGDRNTFLDTSDMDGNTNAQTEYARKTAKFGITTHGPVLC